MSAPPPFAEATRTWARVGILSFGGPAGQIATMHRILVEEKRWISEERFLHALSFCMLLPGPEAMQLATYVGWLLHGVRGGLVAGVLFVVPGLATVLALSALYATFGHVEGAAGALLGLKAAVLAIVLEALLRVGRRSLRSAALVAMAVLAFLALALFGAPFPLVVAVAAGCGWLGHRVLGPRFGAPAAPVGGDPDPAPSVARQARTIALTLAAWFVPLVLVAAAFGSRSTFAELGLFFSRAAVVTFGGAYAVLAYVAQQAVEVHGWLRPGEMVDGLGLAETTPGPLVLVLVFVGFLAGFRDPLGLPALLGGLAGGLVAAWATFAPCFAWIFAGAPHVERLRRQPALAAALLGVTAAVTGVMANLALWFAIHAIFAASRRIEAGPLRIELPILSSVDPVAVALTIAAGVALLRFKAPMIPVIAACLLIGLLARLAWA